MIRKIEKKKTIFLLDTDHTTYCFAITPSGHAEHLYYGKRISVRSPDEAEALTEKRAFEPGNVIVYSKDAPTEIPEDMCLELSGSGHGDIREPFLEIIRSDGSRTTDFLYTSSEINNEKPCPSDLPSAYTENGKTEHLCVTFRDGTLSLELHYCVYPECDVITRSARLINLGDTAIEVERLLSMQLDIPAREIAVTFFHGAWAREMEKSTVPLPAGKFVIESRAGCSSSRANPFFMVHDPLTTEDAGDCWGFNLLYSGSHYAAAEINAFGKIRIVSGIQPQGFRYLLGQNEALEAPEAVMTYSCNGFTGQSIQMHRFIREHIIRGKWKHKERPVLLNSWEACYFHITESTLISMAKAAKELGIELFVMDDGWFGERNDDRHGLGDWEPSAKKLPKGLTNLSKKICSLGMQFGIWVEPEMVNTDSQFYHSHPDWVMEIPQRLHSEGRNQRVLDLANPAVVEHLIETMSGIFSTNGIAYVKWDMNRILSDIYSPYLPVQQQGETAHRYILGLYRLLRTLTDRFPDILFEGCASGGNRFDLGILCYFPQIWASDNTDALCRTRIQEGYSYGYPQSCISAHASACPNHQTLRSTPPETRFGTAAFGILGYEHDIRDLSSEEKQQLKAQIQLYQQWRSVLQFGQFYRCRTGNIHEWICVSPDRKRAVGYLMQELVQPNTQYEVFRAKGLDPQMRYRFYSIPLPVGIKQFGSLINTFSPVHIKPDSLMHNVIAKAVRLDGEKEDIVLSGDTLMNSGIALKQAFSGTGLNENVRVFPDFASRLYFMEAQ